MPKSKNRSQKGGNLSGNPASAWGWVNGTVGNGWNQFMNSLTIQPGANLGSIQSNNLVPIGRVNAQDAQPMLTSNMGGGRRRNKRNSNKRNKRNSNKRSGGSWGAVASQAVVPAILLAAQQTFGKSRKHSGKSYKNKTRRVRF